MSVRSTPVLPRRDELPTAADLEGLSATGARFELVEGRLREMPPAGGVHGFVTKRLDTLLSVFIYELNFGECSAAETGFLTARNPDTVLAPNWAFVRSVRLPNPLPKSFLNLVPDIVMETRSPGDSVRWVEEKTALWLRSGVRVVMNLDPGRGLLSVHRLGRASEILGPNDVLELEELPGLRVPLQTTLR